jgi:hypothetical protein
MTVRAHAKIYSERLFFGFAAAMVLCALASAFL